MMTSGQKILLGLGLGALGYALYSYMSKSEAKAAQSRLPTSGKAPELPAPTPIVSVLRHSAPAWDGTQWSVTGDIRTVTGQNSAVFTRSVNLGGAKNSPPTQGQIMAALLAPSQQASIEL